MTSKLLGIFLSLAVAVHSVHPEEPLPAEISFNRDIRPILSDNCFACHGPDKAARKADLRLDTPEGAVEVRDGIAALVPGKPDQSELLTRVVSHDPDEIMPPPKSERKLSERQVALLRRWIAEGATWEKHWSLIAPRRPELPAVSNEGWCKTSIDRFILARLDREGLKAAPEADRTTLIRRVTYDLTGLPPTLAEIETFLADKAPDAYDRLVDRLLASPRYGEKMAVHWLDLARYADTHGYHLDSGRDMWLWRDWVIEAFNRNLPYDRFVAWQLAGDLLPNATTEQKIATGFLRNNMINFEGGADPKEYHTQYVFDRVNTFGTAFLGLTVACAQCHDHKYDPITQREYYQLYAYFNTVPENGLDGREGNAVPLLELPAPEQTAELERLRANLAAAEKEQRELEKQADAGQREREATLTKPTGQQRSKKELEELQRQYRTQFWPTLIQAQERVAKLQEEVKAAKKRVPSVMIMAEMETPRETFILNRGQFNQPGEKVEPGVLASLPALPTDASKNRLALARWITDPQHPLMARVTVNRFWKQAMGSGLVKTLNDFGSQAEWPSHPELLDWLATEFAGSGWDVKHIMR